MSITRLLDGTRLNPPAKATMSTAVHARRLLEENGVIVFRVKRPSFARSGVPELRDEFFFFREADALPLSQFPLDASGTTELMCS